MILPVITLYQPWATWVMMGLKTIETRTHNRFKSLQGKTILIHAANKIDYGISAMNNHFVPLDKRIFSNIKIDTGCILGSAHVFLYRKLIESDSKRALIDCSTVERYGLFLDKITPFDKPIKIPGQMGIWYFDLNNNDDIGNISNKNFYDNHRSMG